MNQKGQVLVSILIIIAVGTLSVGAAIVSSSLSSTAATSTQSDNLLYSAESGAEEAVMRLLRDPDYSGETINVSGNSVQITVSTPVMNPDQRVVISQTTNNSIQRKVEVLANFTDNILTVTSWRQIP